MTTRSIFSLVASCIAILAISASAAEMTTVPRKILSPIPTTTASAPMAVPVMNPSIAAAAVSNLNVSNLRVLRTIDLTRMTRVPTINLGAASLDLSKLAGPSSEFAQRLNALRAIPDVITVTNVKNEIHEVSDGVLVSNLIQYQLKPNSCRIASSKKRTRDLVLPASVMNEHCGERRIPQDTIAAFANTRSPLFIPDPRARQLATTHIRDTQVAVAREVSDMRAFLATQNASNTLGKAEVNRLRALTDDALVIEMFDSADTVVEEAFFIPRLDRLDVFRSIELMQRPMINPNALRLLQKSPLSSPIVARSITLGPDTFLAGFTLGRNYEWRKRISKTINTCLVGCRRTYFVEPYAKLGLGLGLRFPIRSILQYDYPGRGDAATLTARFQPFNGGIDDYRAAGLEEGKLFDGKEIVAEYTAKAGIKYRLPGVGRGNPEFGTEKDFTRELPAPFTNGQYTPPEPGQRGFLTFEKVFNEPAFDLMMGQANYGVTGARLYPAVNVRLVSDNLSFLLNDKEGRNSSRRIGANRTTTVAVNTSTGESQFSIGSPVYNVAFKIEPGINYRFFIDLAVWGKTWSDTIWIPELTVTLPPIGGDFSCHSGTRCEKSYTIKTSTGAVSSGGQRTNSSQRVSKQPLVCSTKTSYGVWAIKDLRTNQFVRGGVSSEGRRDLVGAVGGSKTPISQPGWETFTLYKTTDGGKYGRWIVNTVDGRYLETVNQTNSLMLSSGRACDTSITDMKWDVVPVNKVGNHWAYRVMNKRTGKYVRTVSGGILKADAQANRADRYLFIRIR